jgi:hypothetical protein
LTEFGRRAQWLKLTLRRLAVANGQSWALADRALPM